MGLWKDKIQKEMAAKPVEKSVFQSGDQSSLKSEITEMNRMETFISEIPIKNMNDLIIPHGVKKQIETAMNRIRYHEVLYNEWNLKKIDPHGSRTAINLYGPPGTGKTFCAEAISQYLNKPIIKVNYAEIESKYVGETPKNITAAFKKAHESDSVLFFDEADSILGKRLTNVTQSADHGVNVSRSVMLLQLDKFNGIVIFASNLPKNYDGAFVRRILAHIEFELPDEDCLIKLWNYLLPDEVPRADDITLNWLAQNSKGFSGGDILNVVKLATSHAVARADDDRKVMKPDIEDAILQVLSAKEKIGSVIERDNQIESKITKETKEIISPDQLPSDVQKDYKIKVSELKGKPL